MMLYECFNEKPTKLWNQRMIEYGDDLFTEERLALCDNFIETMEREELAEFIEKAARLAGLEIEDGYDITEEWREW